MTPPCPGIRWLEVLHIESPLHGGLAEVPQLTCHRCDGRAQDNQHETTGRRPAEALPQHGHENARQGAGRNPADKPRPGLFWTHSRPELGSAQATAGEVRRDVRGPDDRKHPKQPDEAEVRVISHQGRNNGNDGCIEKARDDPEPVASRPRHGGAGKQGRGASQESQFEPRAGERQSGDRRKPGSERDLDRPPPLDSRHPGPLGRNGDAAGQPEQGEGPAALVGRPERQHPEHDRGQNAGPEFRCHPMGSGRLGGGTLARFHLILPGHSNRRSGDPGDNTRRRPP